MSDTKREWVPSVTLLLQNSVFKSGNGKLQSLLCILCVHNRGSSTGRGKIFFWTLNLSKWQWDPPNLQTNGSRKVSSPGDIAARE